MDQKHKNSSTPLFRLSIFLLIVAGNKGKIALTLGHRVDDTSLLIRDKKNFGNGNPVNEIPGWGISMKQSKVEAYLLRYKINKQHSPIDFRKK